MNVTTLPDSRQRRTARDSRSGGRTTNRETYYPVDGATALKPQTRLEPSTTRPRPVKKPAPQPKTTTRLTVAPPAPVTAPRAPFVALVLVLVLTGVIGILVLNTKIAENAFVLDDLHRKQSSLDRDEQRLKSDIAKQESPAYLATRASQFGLGRTTSPASLLLPDGTKLEMPGPSSGK
jgi:hypothetical protein